ncbi:hypothetical protein OG301_39210 (plasmid) [Streptomyces platensis]|uniref:hypothetical protein n=1 Tax=Streptomyces platensis TaxID=58346 RepID=UPI002ED131D9|nr:hypothetical protein OG301_39210 [Streptomyces platensis]
MAELTNKGLQAAVSKLEKKVTRNADSIAEEAKKIDEDAKDTSRVAEQIAAKKVDRDSVAETLEFGKITAGLSEAIIAYASAGHDTAKSAKAAGDQARDSYNGFQEAIDRSTVDGIYDVDAGWFEQV